MFFEAVVASAGSGEQTPIFGRVGAVKSIGGQRGHFGGYPGTCAHEIDRKDDAHGSEDLP